MAVVYGNCLVATGVVRYYVFVGEWRDMGLNDGIIKYYEHYSMVIVPIYYIETFTLENLLYKWKCLVEFAQTQRHTSIARAVKVTLSQ